MSVNAAMDATLSQRILDRGGDCGRYRNRGALPYSLEALGIVEAFRLDHHQLRHDVNLWCAGMR